MSPNMKLSVLAFVGAAAAIPQYGHGHGHAHSSKLFTPSAGTAGHAYPTGGWGNGYNVSTPAVPQAQGTGSSSVPAGEKTTMTESDYTITSTTTRTVYLTQYPTSAEATEVAVKDVSSSAEAACGQTVYVTEKNYVTVTVPAGGYSASAPSSSAPVASSAAPEAPSSYEALKPSTPAEKPSSSPAPVASSSSEAGYEVPSSFELSTTLVNKGQEKPTSAAAATSTPVASEEAVYSSAAPASSIVESSSAPASSASSAPSTGYAGGKRGLAYRWDGAADCKSFQGKGNFGFVWNWEADTKGDVGSFAANFIPTLRTLDNAGDWSSKAQAAIDAGSKVLFGLNEPDISTQANLGVSALCDAWKTHMNPFYGKATIVGPSVSSSENAGQGLDYLGQFVEQCPEAKFDDINIHWYGPASAGFDAFKTHYEKAASQFSGHKIWVTEFGLTGATADESADFLKSAQAYLDGESSCAGYSYFAVGTFDPSANLLGTASALSKTGEIYVS